MPIGSNISNLKFAVNLRRAFGLLLILLLASSLIFSVFTWTAVKEEQEQYLSTIAEIAGRSADISFSRLENDLGQLGQDILRSPAVDAEALLGHYQQANPQVTHLSLARPDGRIVATTDPSGSPTSVAGEPSFAASLQTLREGRSFDIGRPSISAADGDWIMPLRYGLRDRDGELVSIMTAELPLASQQAHWTGVSMPKDTGFGLLRDDAYLVSRYAHLNSIDMQSAYGQARSGVLIQALRASGFPGSGIVEGSADLDGGYRVFAYHRLEQQPITLFVSFSHAHLLNKWWSAVSFPYALFLVLGLCGMGVYRWALSQQTIWEKRREESSKALRESESRLAEASKIANLVYWEFDCVAQQFVLNDHVYALLRMNAEQAGGYTFAGNECIRNFIHAEDVEKVQNAIGQAMCSTDPAFELQEVARMFCGDGQIRWMDIHFRTLSDAGGQLIKIIGAMQDVDERMQQEFSLQRQRGILEAARDLISSTDKDGNLIYMNQAGRQILGLRDDDATPTHISACHPPQVTQMLIGEAIPSAEQHGYWEGEIEFLTRSGQTIPAWQVIVAHRLPSGEVHFSTIARDLRERKQAEAQLRLMAQVFEHSGEALMITDATNRIVATNLAFTKITGYTQDEVLNRDPKLLSAGKTSRQEYAEMWAAIINQGFWQGEVWDRHKDGRAYPKWLSITALHNDHHEIIHYIAGFSDITEHKAAEEKIHHLAHHDGLTNLLNRLALQAHLEQALSAAHRNAEKLAVLFIDLDRFKTINDTLGHHIGDTLLIEVANRLKQCIRASDIVARLGGDEFIVALPGVESSRDAAHVAEKILKALAQPYSISERTLHTTPSIGISIFPDDAQDEEILMKNADVAMYYAKDRGRNNYQFFAESMNQAATERLNIESGLRHALEHEQFLIHYQPQIEVTSGQIVGFEALVRWAHPDEGLIPPTRFIPVAEETGLILPLGEWVLRSACRQLKKWHSEGMAGMQIAVNLSAFQFRQKDLPDLVARCLADSGLNANYLELEITETAAMENPQAAIGTLNALRTMGVTLAIDDFGTGYSSLTYLKLFPIDRLKLDRSFVKDIEADQNDAAICAATIALAHNLGLEVVAEGVETEQQYAYLKSLSCDKIQGYWFSKPLPAESIPAYVNQRRSPSRPLIRSAISARG